MRERFHDDGGEMVVAAMGPKVARLLAGWRAGYRGPCKHPDAEQWTLSGDRRSVCLGCARASSALAAWESTGPCSLCGAFLAAPPARTWTVPSGGTRGVQVLVRLCPACIAEELSDVNDPIEGETDE